MTLHKVVRQKEKRDWLRQAKKAKVPTEIIERVKSRMDSRIKEDK